MQTVQETVLATIPGASDRDRLVVMMAYDPQAGSTIQLRQQSWGDGLGWYTQNSMAIDPQQLTQLRAALGSGGASARLAWQAPARADLDSPQLRLVHADSA